MVQELDKRPRGEREKWMSVKSAIVRDWTIDTHQRTKKQLRVSQPLHQPATSSASPAPYLDAIFRSTTSQRNLNALLADQWHEDVQIANVTAAAEHRP